MPTSHRTRSDRYRCPDCGNRNESRLCVLSEDDDEPPLERRMHCVGCGLTAPAARFVPHAYLRDIDTPSDAKSE